MALRKFSNNAKSVLAVAIGAGDTHLTVETGDGGLFPSVTAGNDEACSVKVSGGGYVEYMTCTGRSGDTLTVVRSASPFSFAAGSKVESPLTADDLSNFIQKEAYREVGADPNGTDPVYNGEMVYNTANQSWYKHCPGSPNTSWKRLTL